MSWFKKSSNLLEIPKELFLEINEIADKAIEYIKGKNNNKVFLGKIDFINKYNENKEDFVYIVIFPEDKENSNAMSVYNSSKKTITIFAYHVISKDLEYLKKLFIETIYHEITHAIDPKFKLNRPQQNKKYVDLDYEFDGICAQIIQHIKLSDNFDKKDLINWLVYQGENLPNYLYAFKEYIMYWKKNNIKWFKKLIQRIYSEVINDR